MRQLLTCDQAYQIWLSEPEILQIWDLRQKDQYLESHIPGSRLMSWAELERSLPSTDPRFPILVLGLDSSLRSQFLDLQRLHPHLMELDQCHQWAQKGFALTGDSVATWDVKNLLKEDLMSRGHVIQLFEAQSSTYTYIIYDEASKEAAIIDPVLETVERDLKLVSELGLKLNYVLDTHIHADHITGASEIRRLTGAKTGVSQVSQVACCDIPLENGQELLLGNIKLKVLATPGHTDGCLSYYFDGHVFTGDALLIRGCGRTDFQQGSSQSLFDSVTKVLFSLPPETIVCPGHDYRGFTKSTIGHEKAFNPRLGGGVTLESFVKTMSELKLADPKKIHEALPANLACGQPRKARALNPQVSDGIPEVSVHQVYENRAQVTLIDVRRPDEFNGEYGHIEGARLITLGPDLMKYIETEEKDKEIVFICRSGGRSGQATAVAQELGLKNAVNMVGGMITWNLQQLPVVRE